MIPLHPPADWFAKPDWLAPLQKLTVITEGPETGRVAGYVAPFGECILDGKPGCWTVPPSPTNYSAAHQGETLTAEGELIRTANIGGGVNHARASANFTGAVDHYQHTASQLMRVVYGEDDHGVWCAGALWDDITERGIAIVRASALSGDWRYRPELGAFDMSGAQLVNTPGFPLIRELARAAALGEPVLAYVGGLGGAAPVEDEDDEPCPTCSQPLGLDARVGALAALIEAAIASHDARLADVESVLADAGVTAAAGDRFGDIEAAIVGLSTEAEEARTAAIASRRRRLVVERNPETREIIEIVEV